MEQLLFAERLITLRKNASLSQSRVAAALGVSRQAVGKWESGKSTPSLSTYRALAALYGVSADRLLTGAEYEGDHKALSAVSPLFPARLRELRTRQKVAQGTLATMLGVSRQSVSKWERGESEPDLDRLVAIAKALEIPVESLLPVNESPTLSEEGEEKTDTNTDTDTDTQTQNGETAKALTQEKETPSEKEDAPHQEKETLEADRAIKPSETPENTDTAETVKAAPEAPFARRLTSTHTCKKLKKVSRKRVTSAQESPTESEKKNKKLAFRTIAELGPNDAAYVYVNKNDGKVRTMLPFLASIPICAITIAMIVKKKFRK